MQKNLGLVAVWESVWGFLSKINKMIQNMTASIIYFYSVFRNLLLIKGLRKLGGPYS